MVSKPSKKSGLKKGEPEKAKRVREFVRHKIVLVISLFCFATVVIVNDGL